MTGALIIHLDYRIMTAFCDRYNPLLDENIVYTVESLILAQDER